MTDVEDGPLAGGAKRLTRHPRQARGDGSTLAASTANASPSSGSLSSNDSALATSCPPRATRALVPCLAALRESEHREPRCEREPDERAEGQEREAAVPTSRPLPGRARSRARRRSGSSTRGSRRRARRGRSPTGRSRRCGGCGGARVSRQRA